MTIFLYPENDEVKFERWFSMLLESTMSDKRQTVATILEIMLIYAKERIASVLLNQRSAAFKKCSEDLHRSASDLLKECPELQMALNQYLEADNQIEIPTELTNEWLALTLNMTIDEIFPRTTWSSSSLTNSDSEIRRRALKRFKVAGRKFRARKRTKSVDAVKRKLTFSTIPPTSGADLESKSRDEESTSELPRLEIESSKSAIEKPTEPPFKKFRFWDLLACFITIKAEIRCIQKGFKCVIGQWRLHSYKPQQVYHDCTPPRSSFRSPLRVRFNHIELIGFFQRINNYFEKQPPIYQKIISILYEYGLQYKPRKYVSESKRGPPITKVMVCQEIAELIRDANLLQEFIQFLPHFGYLCRNATRIELLNR